MDAVVYSSVVMVQQAPQVGDVDDRFRDALGHGSGRDVPGKFPQGSRGVTQQACHLLPEIRGQRHQRTPLAI